MKLSKQDKLDIFETATTWIVVFGMLVSGISKQLFIVNTHLSAQHIDTPYFPKYNNAVFKSEYNRDKQIFGNHASVPFESQKN